MQAAPQPRITDINRPFWDGCRTGMLMLQRCCNEPCRRYVFYPRVCCPYCGHGELQWQQASGIGHLVTWTIVHRPGHDAFNADAPYVFAAVTLQEGPVIHGRMLVPADTATLTIDAPVRVVFHAAADGSVMPAFVPATLPGGLASQ